MRDRSGGRSSEISLTSLLYSARKYAATMRLKTQYIELQPTNWMKNLNEVSETTPPTLAAVSVDTPGSDHGIMLF